MHWYPEKLMVSPEGTGGTYNFMRTVFESTSAFCYAEFGIYKGDTARHVCNLFPKSTLYLFDFDSNIEFARAKLKDFSNQINYYGNTQKYNDSYNWSLTKLIANSKEEKLFDYCFLDGAHTVAIDALTFFLCDILLKVGGYMDFDDYNWRIRGSSLDPSKVPQIGEQYTEEQIDTFQVKLIVDAIVRMDRRYEEVVKQKIFRKIRD